MSAEDPRAVPRARYRELLTAREGSLAALEARDTTFSRARVACFVTFLILVVAGWQLSLSWLWLGVPALAFVILIVIHERVLERRDRAARAVAHYREGLERLADRFAGLGAGGGATATDYVEADHPYAADLDLFGEASLFELLCRARTRAGEEQLARWLSCHASERVDAEAIRARQRSVRALIEGVELREDLAVLGAAARVEVRPEVLIDWGGAPSMFSARARRWVPILGLALPALAILACLAWALGAGVLPLIAIVLAEGAVYRGLKDTLARAAGPADRHGHELSVLAAVLARVEAEAFEEPRLVELRAILLGGIRAGGAGEREPASAAIAGLRRLSGWYEAQRNGLFAPIAVLLMWGPNFALAIERWRLRNGPRIAAWIGALAELEALASLASHAYENPDDPFPELLDDARPEIAGEGLGHPLLPRESCVRNDLSLAGPVRAHVISGSNMSGKSTFLRTVGCNVVLALAGAPVRATRLRLTPVRIGATLRIQDSLREGASRFWAELTRLRVITELAEAEATLFLLDEIFHGTNSHDRRIGAEALLEGLLEHGAVGLMTTHDLALAQAAEALAPAATNVHFQDDLHEGELRFDYRMREGVVRKSNALELMRVAGLRVPSTPAPSTTLAE